MNSTPRRWRSAAPAVRAVALVAACLLAGCSFGGSDAPQVKVIGEDPVPYDVADQGRPPVPYGWNAAAAFSQAWSHADADTCRAPDSDLARTSSQAIYDAWQCDQVLDADARARGCRTDGGGSGALDGEVLSRNPTVQAFTGQWNQDMTCDNGKVEKVRGQLALEVTEAPSGWRVTAATPEPWTENLGSNAGP